MVQCLKKEKGIAFGTQTASRLCCVLVSENVNHPTMGAWTVVLLAMSEVLVVPEADGENAEYRMVGWPPSTEYQPIQYQVMLNANANTNTSTNANANANGSWYGVIL